MNLFSFLNHRRSKSVAVVLFAAFLAACSSASERGAFNLQSDQIGDLDSKGFPILHGGQYQRDVPLKRTIERARLESELQAIAEAQASTSINVNKRRNELLQQRLQEIARTHGAAAEAEIAAACKTDANGVITCNTD